MILLTHGDFDHSGNAAYLREKFGAKIAMHLADAGVVEHGDIFWNRKKGFFLARKIVPFALGFKKADRFVPDVLVDDESDLSDYGFPARVISIPGHSQGSIALLTDAGDLFCGDLIINPGVPETTTIIDDEGAAEESVRRLMDVGINTIYPGHGRPFTWGEFLQTYKTKKG